MKKILVVALVLTGLCSESFANSLEDVQAERAYHRAKEAVLWSQGMMGVALSINAIRKLGGDYNDIGYLSKPAILPS